MTVDREGRGELLVRDVAAPVLGDGMRVDDRPEGRRGELVAQRPCEASDVGPKVLVGLGLPVLPDPEEETRGGRVLALRRNSRPDLFKVEVEHLGHLLCEHHGLQAVLCSSLEVLRGRIPY